MDRHQLHGVGLDAFDRRLGLARPAVFQVGDQVDEGAQLPALLFLEATGEAQQLVDVGKPSLGPVQTEHVALVASLGDSPLEQLGDAPPPGLGPLGLEPGHEGSQHGAVALRELAGVPGGRLQRLPQGRAGRAAGGGEKRQAITRAAGERRGQRRVERLLVARVRKRPQVAVKVLDLLAAPERPDAGEGPQPLQLQRPLEGLDVPGRAQQDRDLVGPRLAAVDELADALREQPRLGLAPERGVRQPSGDRRGRGMLPPVLRGAREQHLDERAAGRGAALLPAAVYERREVGEATAEDGVDRLDHLRPAAEVAAQRKRAAGRSELLAALAEQPHVGVAEAVDGLQLVADREQVAAVERAQDRELARVGVLELVDHQQLEALRPGHAQVRVLGEQRAREQLEVVEVDRHVAALELLVRLGELHEQLVVQGHRAPRLGILGPCGLTQRKARAQLADAAQLGVDRLDRRAHDVDPVGGEHIDGRCPAAREAGQSGLERASAQHARGGRVEHAEIGVQPGGQRVRAQQPPAEGVERADGRGLRVAGGAAFTELQQTRPHALSQLARGAVGEGDRQHRRRFHPVLAHRRHEALDEHGGLAAARRCREQDRLAPARHGLPLLAGERQPGRRRRRLLLVGQRELLHGLSPRSGRSSGTGSRLRRHTWRAAP